MPGCCQLESLNFSNLSLRPSRLAPQFPTNPSFPSLLLSRGKLFPSRRFTRCFAMFYCSSQLLNVYGQNYGRFNLSRKTRKSTNDNILIKACQRLCRSMCCSAFCLSNPEIEIVVVAMKHFDVIMQNCFQSLITKLAGLDARRLSEMLDAREKISASR